jgi:hypothetical protein
MMRDCRNSVLIENSENVQLKLLCVIERQLTFRYSTLYYCYIVKLL